MLLKGEISKKPSTYGKLSEGLFSIGDQYSIVYEGGLEERSSEVILK